LFLARKNGQNIKGSRKYQEKYQQKLLDLEEGLKRKMETMKSIEIFQDQRGYTKLQGYAALTFYTEELCRRYLEKVFVGIQEKVEFVESHRSLHARTVRGGNTEKAGYDQLVEHLMRNPYLVDPVEELYFEEYGELSGEYSQISFLENEIKRKERKARRASSSTATVRSRVQRIVLNRGSLVECYDTETGIWWPYMVVAENGDRGRYIQYKMMCLFPRHEGCEFWQGYIEEKNMYLSPSEGVRTGCWKWTSRGEYVLNEETIEKVQDRINNNRTFPPESIDDILRDLSV